jgi:hypothetical protein
MAIVTITPHALRRRKPFVMCRPQARKWQK